MERINIRTAAKLMHKDPDFLREGLRQNILPFGSAVKVNKRYSYYISPEKFYEYIGKRK